MPQKAQRTIDLRQSDIRAVTQLVNAHNGINLGQGICDLPTPDAIKHGAINAIENDKSIYSYHSGILPLRKAIAEKYHSFNNIDCDPETEVMVTVGSTGSFVAACLACLNPGDEVLVFEPFYGYHVNLLKILGFKPIFVPLEDKTWAVDFSLTEKAITPKTKAVIITTPGNPNGKVWSEAELQTMLKLLQKYDLWAFTDEVYEYMIYDNHKHISLASLEGGFERTLTISSYSKTYNMTGWRMGSVAGPAQTIEKMGLINDLIYICPPTPLQYGLLEAFSLSDDYLSDLDKTYKLKRNQFMDALRDVGFEFTPPEGAYYIFANFEQISKNRTGFENDRIACETLIKEVKIASVPGSSFFSVPERGNYYLRFCYAKQQHILDDACKMIRSLKI